MVKKNINAFVFFILLAMTLLFSFVSAGYVGNYKGNIVITNPGNGAPITIGDPVPYCGDGHADYALKEDCDGSVGSTTCTSYINDGKIYTGSLSCSSQCTFVATNCVAPADDGGEIPGGGGGGGGGGSGGSSCIENWNCTAWGVCDNGTQTRVCTDSNKCNTVKLKPASQRSCSVNGASGDEGIGLNQNDKGFFNNLFTGAFLGTNGGKWSLGIIIFLILVGLAWWIVAWKKKQDD